MKRWNYRMSANFEIIVGTYEEFLLGYKIKNVGNEYKLEHSFATHSHQASIRNVTSRKHYLASAGADDSVYLYDMRHRVESGRLTHHSDTVNCIAFTSESSHILTCSNDGSIAAIRCGNWQVEKHWKSAHKGSPVNTMSIHPTGKIALSIGGDGVLRTWNLVKGRQAYATNLVPRLGYDAKHITVLKWSPDGDKYLLAVNAKLEVYSVETAGVVNEIKFESKIVCAEFLNNDLVAIGHDDGKLRFYNLEDSSEVLEKIAHDIRVKCVAHDSDFIATAASSGEIKLWKFTKKNLELLATVNCGARITCLVLALPCEGMVVKKEEVKAEEQVPTRIASKFRIRQEVIIEDEGEEMEESSKSSVKRSKKKPKKKLKQIQSEELTTQKKNQKRKQAIVNDLVSGHDEAEKEAGVPNKSPNRKQKLKQNSVGIDSGESPLKKQRKSLNATGDQTLKKKKNKQNGNLNGTIDLRTPPSGRKKKLTMTNTTSKKTKKTQHRFSGQNWNVEETA